MGWPEATGGLSINLVGERRMRFLNWRHRKINKATDALSLPLHEKTALKKKLKAASAKKTGSSIIELGDVFICPSIIQRQVHQEKQNPKWLLGLLTVHSILHLFGFDHKRSVKEANEMAYLERRIMKKLLILPNF